MKKTRIGNASASKEEVGFGSLSISELNDGSPIEVPICIMNGAKEGPCLWIQNGVHGDEYVGAAAIGRLIQEVDVTTLRGSLVLIPVLNTQAFRAGTRMAPQDRLDMNRIWPGAPMESAMHLWAHSELVTHEVIHLIKEHADALVDVHDAGWMGLMSPFVTYYTGPTKEFDKQVRAMAIACGMDLVWEADSVWIQEKAPGSVRVPMNQVLIPSIEVECGGSGRLNKAHFERMLDAYLNVLRHLDMIDGDPVVPTEQIFVNRANWVRAPVGGFLNTHVDPLDPVKAGQSLATITDLFGREREVLLSPTDGWIVGKRTFGTVQTGQYIMTVVLDE